MLLRMIAPTVPPELWPPPKLKVPWLPDRVSRPASAAEPEVELSYQAHTKARPEESTNPPKVPLRLLVLNVPDKDEDVCDRVIVTPWPE